VKPAFGRRAMLLSALAGPWPVIAAASSPTAPAQASSAPLPDPVRPGRPMVFPRDHGAHPGSRIEWWYVTGWLLPQSLSAGAASGSAAQAMAPSAGTGAEDDARRLGFQVTFFRSATGKGDGLLSRFAPRQLLFAHAALSDLAARRHDHAQRLARWSGQADAALRDRAMLNDADVAVGGWQLLRTPGPGALGMPGSQAQSLDSRWLTRVDTPDFTLDLSMAPTQPALLQGEQGWSRKGPQPSQASHYVSLPQLQVSGRLTRRGATQAVAGRAWFDHEWSDELLHPQAVGWDWIGMNLHDGSALTAFVLRRADGSALWAGGSLRSAAGALRVFGADEVRWQPGRTWRSPVTGASYPVQWSVQTPSGRFTVQALADAQELDNRSSIGTAYWEGLSALLDAQDRRVGLGYLEMTGYAGRLVI